MLGEKAVETAVLDSIMGNTSTATLAIAEMREFASFSSCEQRYIKRSLDVGLARGDAFLTWARDAGERNAIRSQYLLYQELKYLRAIIPHDENSEGVEDFLAPLARLAAFDLAQERLACFASFRFLYERLLGAEIRPWLPSAFCAAAALPSLRPERRKILLQSISEAAATAPGWSVRQPSFFPEYIAEAA